MSIALETDAEWKPNPGNATQRLSNVVEKFNLKFGRTRNLSTQNGSPGIDPGLPNAIAIIGRRLSGAETLD